MSGFGNFGTGFSSGGLFGGKQPDSGSGGFTMPTTTIATTTNNTTFGTPTFGATSSWGLASFGTGTGTGTGTGFGAKPVATTADFTFGTTPANTKMSTFVMPASSASLTTFGTATTFGSTVANTTIPTFGTSTAGAKSSFGSFGTSTATAPGTASFSFGLQKTTATTGFTFSSNNMSATTSTAPKFNLGSTSTASTVTAVTTVTKSAPLTFAPLTSTVTTSGTLTSTSLKFSPLTTPVTTSTPTLLFGISAAATTAAPTVTFGLTATTTSGTGLTFGASAATTTSTTSLSGFTLTSSCTTTTTTSLTFGIPKTTFGTTVTTTLPSFNLGTTTTTTSSLGTGLFSATKTTEATATASVGLGGVDYAQNTGSGTLEPKQPKDHNLPEPILQTLNEFQNFTKQQKSISVEISHGSSKPLKKVQEDIEAMESLLTMITRGLTKNAIAVDKLKTETTQGLHQAEMAQRNHEAPPELDYDSSAPTDYFNDLVTKFETDTVRLGVQIEASEKHLNSLTQSSTISPQELTLAMRRLHETLIVLAAQVQALHTSVQSQKEQYKNFRRVYFKDDINIFESETDPNLLKKQAIYSLRGLTGPTPFSETPAAGSPFLLDGLAMLASSANVSAPSTSNPSWMSPLQGSPNTSSILPGSNLLGSFQPLGIPGFQLSKPPTGNKRSKR